MRQIEAFRAVALVGSMTGAARLLSVTQPAVSRLIRDLEHELGFTLFERRKGGLHLSEEALSLFAEVEQSFRGLERIAQTARQIREVKAGQLRIGGMPALTLSFLPMVIESFLRDRPSVSISLQTHNSPRVIEYVRARQYDLGLAMTPIDSSAVEVSRVLRAHCLCVLPDGHRLAAKEIVTAEDLRDETFISLANDTMTRFRIDAVFDSANIRRNRQIETRWSATICALVDRGLGVSIIEPFTAAAFAARGGIVRPFKPSIEFTFALIFPAQRRKPPLLEAFLGTLDKALEPYLELAPDQAF